MGFVALVLWGGIGCGPRWGAMLYFMGAGSKPIKAVYELPEGPKLILVDDDQDLLPSPHVQMKLVDGLAKELRAHDYAERVTTNEELARLRQAEPEFEKIPADEVGRKVQADVVIWLAVEAFEMPDDLDMAVEDSVFVVTLKVVNAKATEREEVRLWPPDPDGYRVRATVSPHDLRQADNLPQAYELLAEAMAKEVGQLFYDHEPE